MRKIALIAGIVLAIGAGSAQAADLPRGPVTKAPVMAPLPTWQGIYWGIHGGWGWGDADRTIALFDPMFGLFPPAGAASNDIDGGIFGGHVGFNWQASPNWLFGLEASLAWSGVDGTANSPVAAGFTISSDLEWLATVTPRLGWTSNNWLFYVKGGLAGGRLETVSTLGPGGPVFTGENSMLGWTAGVGLEWMWSPNWIFGIEYNYYDLGSENIGGAYAPGGAPAGQTVDVKFSSVLARLSYKY
jgi:outer membrane immunogenic protein